MSERLRRIPRQARAASTVDAILTAALQLLETVGVEQLTTNHVADRAGVSIGTARAGGLREGRGARPINGARSTFQANREYGPSRDLHYTAALEKEMEIGVPVSMSEDRREGTKAFKEKRKLVFHGR